MQTSGHAATGDGRRVDWRAYACWQWATNGRMVSGVGDFKRYEYVGQNSVSERTLGGEVLYSLQTYASGALLPAGYATDHVGSIRQVVNSGSTKNWYDYDPFGQPNGRSEQLRNSYRFPSAPLDGVTANGQAYNSFEPAGAAV